MFSCCESYSVITNLIVILNEIVEIRCLWCLRRVQKVWHWLLFWGWLFFFASLVSLFLFGLKHTYTVNPFYTASKGPKLRLIASSRNSCAFDLTRWKKIFEMTTRMATLGYFLHQKFNGRYTLRVFVCKRTHNISDKVYDNAMLQIIDGIMNSLCDFYFSRLY